MNKRIDLIQHSLLLGDSVPVDVGRYTYARIGNYTTEEIEQRRLNRILEQLSEEKLCLPIKEHNKLSDKQRAELNEKYWERRKELEPQVKPDDYVKFMMLIYKSVMDINPNNLGSDVNINNLGNNISKSIPEEMRNSIKIYFHLPSYMPIHQALLPSHASRHSLEIMAKEDVELGMRF